MLTVLAVSRARVASVAVAATTRELRQPRRRINVAPRATAIGDTARVELDHASKFPQSGWGSPRRPGLLLPIKVSRSAATAELLPNSRASTGPAALVYDSHGPRPPVRAAASCRVVRVDRESATVIPLSRPPRSKPLCARLHPDDARPYPAAVSSGSITASGRTRYAHLDRWQICSSSNRTRGRSSARSLLRSKGRTALPFEIRVVTAISRLVEASLVRASLDRSSSPPLNKQRAQRAIVYRSR